MCVTASEGSNPSLSAAAAPRGRPAARLRLAVECATVTALRTPVCTGYRHAMAVEITLLGPPRVTRDGEPVVFETRKAVALLAHLALTDAPRSREALCELLYPGLDADRARAALRRTLSTLRTGIGEELIEAAGDNIALRRGAGCRPRRRAVPRAGGRRRERLGRRGGALRRRLPRGLLAARQPRLRRLARGDGGRPGHRAARRSSAPGRAARRTGRLSARSSTRAAGSRSTRSRSRPIAT